MNERIVINTGPLIPSVRACVDKMIADGGWFDPELLKRFYAAIGE